MKKNRWKKWLLLLFVISFVISLIYFFKTIFINLFIGFIIAYLLDPVIDWFENKRINRSLGILISFFILFIIIFFIFLIVVPSLIIQIKELILKIPALITWITNNLIPWLENKLHINIPTTVHDLTESLRQKAEKILPHAWGPLYTFLQRAFSSGVSLLSTLSNLLLIPFFAYYLLKDYDKIIEWIYNEIPAKYRQSIASFFREVDQNLSSFFRGQLTVMLILSVLYSIGLSIVGLKLAIAIGILSGLLNIIPYFGVATGLFLSILMAIAGGNFLHDLIGVAIVFTVVQTLEGVIITPKIVGDKVGLNPLWVIISLMAGAHIYGIVGMLLAIPVASILKIFIKRGIEIYHKSSIYNYEKK